MERDKERRELARQIADKAKELSDLVDKAALQQMRVTFHCGSQTMTSQRSEIFGVTSVQITEYYYHK